MATAPEITNTTGRIKSAGSATGILFCVHKSIGSHIKHIEQERCEHVSVSFKSRK